VHIAHAPPHPTYNHKPLLNAHLHLRARMGARARRLRRAYFLRAFTTRFASCCMHSVAHIHRLLGSAGMGQSIAWLVTMVCCSITHSQPARKLP
jgi:hypothetical protein